MLAFLVVGCGDVVKLENADAVCGNSAVETGEECDTGVESAGCNDDCTRATCGDSKVNAMAGEDCDDGNAIDSDACNNSCKDLTTAPTPMPFTSTGVDGAFAPVGNTTLTPGIKNYTTINIPVGVTVTVSGYGALDLRATGSVVIDGTINLSGGIGGDGATGFNTANCDTGGGGGGATGTRAAGSSGAGVTCPVASGGGSGTSGANGGIRVGGCAAPGGNNGGGAGAGTCAGGAGGGGYAGGGGGAGYDAAKGGVGAAVLGFLPAAGGTGSTVSDGTGRTPGLGGRGMGAYAGQDGTFMVGCVMGLASHPASSGGGGAIGTSAHEDLAVRDTFYAGSGGGGGGGQCQQCFMGSGGGGGGGGALRVASAASITISATGQLLANGGNGGNPSALNGAAGGGGGSGGVIYLSSPSLMIASGGVVSAIGGTGANSTPATCGHGGNGGLGRIRISAGSSCTLSGTFTPPLASGCSPSAMAETVYVATYPN